MEQGNSYSYVIIDIDHFKKVNDTFGHSIGDEVLVFLADNIKKVASEGDVCCRFGGEEFVLLLKDKNKHEAYQIVEQLRKTIESTVSPSGENITISAGIASYPECTADMNDLFEIADRCLYVAKNTGRNKCTWK